MALSHSFLGLSAGIIAGVVGLGCGVWQTAEGILARDWPWSAIAGLNLVVILVLFSRWLQIRFGWSKLRGAILTAWQVIGDSNAGEPPYSPHLSAPGNPASEGEDCLAAVDQIKDLSLKWRAQSRRFQILAEEQQGILQASPIPLAVVELNTWRFVEANDSLLTLLGWTQGELINHSDQELMLWPDEHARESWWTLVREKRRVNNVECVLQSRSGEQLKVMMSSVVISHRDSPHALVTIVDMSERTTHEEHLRQSQKLEAIGRLAAGFAHDFNNILCIIQGHATLTQAEPGLDASACNSLRQITTATERAANLTRQLLAFSRKQIMRPKSVELNPTIQGMTNMLLRILGERVTLQLNCSADAPAIRVDTGMLEQVILNLAMNARDAMPLGGALTISTGAFVVDSHYVGLQPEARVGTYAYIGVRDTGRGLDSASIKRIFEPFFTTKDVGKGTGLGLAAAYGIIKQHNGWIEASSQPGKGTTFKIFLPSIEAAPESNVAQPHSSLPFSGTERILVVEDEPGLLALVRSVLERYGYQVLGAGNGVQATEVWSAHHGKIDLLLTDIVMPEGMTGRDLAEKLRADKPDLKVIFTSGYSADLTGVVGEELIEGYNFIQKPYRPQLLAKAIRSRLDCSMPTATAAPAAAF